MKRLRLQTRPAFDLSAESTSLRRARFRDKPQADSKRLTLLQALGRLVGLLHPHPSCVDDCAERSLTCCRKAGLKARRCGQRHQTLGCKFWGLGASRLICAWQVCHTAWLTDDVQTILSPRWEVMHELSDIFAGSGRGFMCGEPAQLLHWSSPIFMQVMILHQQCLSPMVQGALRSFLTPNSSSEIRSRLSSMIAYVASIFKFWLQESKLCLPQFCCPAYHGTLARLSCHVSEACCHVTA